MLNTNIMRITFEIDSKAKVEYMNKLDGKVDWILFFDPVNYPVCNLIFGKID